MWAFLVGPPTAAGRTFPVSGGACPLSERCRGRPRVGWGVTWGSAATETFESFVDLDSYRACLRIGAIDGAWFKKQLDVASRSRERGCVYNVY